MHIIAAIKAIFTVCMLIDAHQRRVPSYWYFIIFMPFGAVIYFLTIKVHDYQFANSARRKISSALVKQASLGEIEYEASQTPSFSNRLKLAQAYFDHSNYDKAQEVFTELLSTENDNRAILYGLGVTNVEQGRNTEAEKYLKKVISIDPSYNDYAATVELATLFWKSERKNQAIELFQELVTKSQRISHQVQLAEYLIEVERLNEARALLDQATKDFNASPKHIKNRDKRWARKAKKLL